MMQPLFLQKPFSLLAQKVSYSSVPLAYATLAYSCAEYSLSHGYTAFEAGAETRI